MQGRGRDAGLAAVMVVLLHLALFQLLMRASQVTAPGAADASVVEVVWLRPQATPTAPSPSRQPARGADADARPVPPRPAAATAAAPAASKAPTPDAPPDGRPLTAVYLSQARDPSAAPPMPQRDLLRDRPVALPGAGEDRFRMREPPSVARVVAGIGRMFGGEDPDAPCRDHRRSIRELSLHGDSADLQRHLDVERRLCRP